MNFFWKNKNNKKKPFNTKDVIFPHENKVVRLKERTLKIEVSAKKIKESFKNHRTRFILTGALLIVVVGAGYFLFPSKADVVYSYPTSCLGGWENPQSAQGQPNIEPGVPVETFNVENSAALRNAVAQIFCAGFQIDAPENSQPVKAVLKLSWLIKNPTLEENPTATSTDVLIPEFPLISPTPTSTEIAISPTPENSLEPEEILETTPSLEPSATATIESTPETTLEPTLTPILEIVLTPTSTPEPTFNPTPEPTPEISSTPISFWKKIFLPALAQEISVTPTPEITSTPTPTIEITPEPTPEATLELMPTLTPEPTPSPTSGLTPTPESSFLKQEPELSAEPTAGPPESGSITPTLAATEEVSPSATPATSPEASLALEGREPPAAFLQISYSLDGINWNSLAKIGFDNWQDLELEIPVTNWDDLINLQISIQTLPTVDLLPDIYLDGMSLEVTYNFYEEGFIDESVGPEQVNLEPTAATTFQLLKTRKLNRAVFIDSKAEHNCRMEPFQIDVSQGGIWPAKIILQKNGNSVEELEIGSLPDGIDLIFSKNNDYVYYPGQEETSVDLTVTKQDGSQNGSFSVPVLYSDRQRNQTVICQLNIVNF